MARPKSKFSGPSKVYNVRLSESAYTWVRSLGDLGPDIVRSIIDEYRTSTDERFLDRALADAKDDLMSLETEVLDVKRRIKDMEAAKARLIDSQLDHLRVRQRLIEKYMQSPDHFLGWLTGPANYGLVSEGGFGSPTEVAEFCRKEMDKYRGGKR